MCGYYLAIGMPMDEYWNASPHLVKWYRQAHKLRIEERNQELWLQGLYIYNAFGTVLANAFGKKGSQKHKYIEKPIELYPKSAAESEQEIMKTRNKVVNTLNSMAAKFASRTAGKEEKADGN